MEKIQDSKYLSNPQKDSQARSIITSPKRFTVTKIIL